MDFLNIIERARRLTHTTEANYNNTQAVEDWNFVYQELVDEIVVNTKGDYFWDKWVTNTVVNQSEYLAEKLWISPDDLDIKKINKVFVKYSADSKFIRATYQNPGVLPEHPDYYKTNQSKSEPFFYIQDTSFFLYPAPTEEIVGWIEIFVIHTPSELNINSTSDDIEIPSQFHKLISLWIRISIYEDQGKINESIQAQNEYRQGVKKMLDFMKQRYNQPMNKTFILNQYR